MTGGLEAEPDLLERTLLLENRSTLPACCLEGSLSAAVFGQSPRLNSVQVVPCTCVKCIANFEDLSRSKVVKVDPNHKDPCLDFGRVTVIDLTRPASAWLTRTRRACQWLPPAAAQRHWHGHGAGGTGSMIAGGHCGQRRWRLGWQVWGWGRGGVRMH